MRVLRRELVDLVGRRDCTISESRTRTKYMYELPGVDLSKASVFELLVGMQGIGFGPNSDYQNIPLWISGDLLPPITPSNSSGGASMRAATPRERLLNRVQCAADYGDEQSLAMHASEGAPPNFLENIALPNTASGIVDLGLDVFGDRTPTGSEAANVLLSGGGQGLPGGSAGFKGATGVLQDSGLAAVGGQTAVDFGTGVGYLKLGYDALTVIYGFFGPCR